MSAGHDVLIVRMGGLGDQLVLWPVVAQLAERGASVTLWGTNRFFEPLAQQSKRIRTLGEPSHLLARALAGDGLDQWSDIAGRFDRVILVSSQSLPGEHVERIDPWPSMAGVHVAEHYCRALGLDWYGPECVPILKACPLVTLHRACSSGMRLLIAPSAGRSIKRCDRELLGVAREAAARGIEIGILSGLGSLPEAVSFARQAGQWIDYEIPIHRPKGVLQMMDVITAHDLFAGCCSGPGHMAGLLGLDTTIFYRVTHPDQWRPLGPRVRVAFAEDFRPEAAAVMLSRPGGQAHVRP